MNSLALCLARICVEFRISHFEFSALLLAWLLGLANSTAAADTYAVVQSRIYKNGLPVQWRGANALDVYSVTESDMQAMDSWGLDIVREVVGNMRDNPLSGGPQNIGGSWLYSLQSIVDAHRAHGRVTILCPFNWDGASANQFVGKNPSSMPWFTDYLTRYREWATQFKDQPDVWFELWNEPYDWQGGNGYSEALWLADMQTMVDNIRSIAPNNLILVPGARMGGDETVIAHQGPALLAGRTNLVFDCHAYEAWLYDSQASVESRV
ncbi:MAG TPA: cellulase family glycosylhydrolase, partial [Candidatus Sulfotelmatobacter sp.]|nr:cellulase family glycosylhydrolase [Candidatus Sulfotelmatobacter sp.]